VVSLLQTKLYDDFGDDLALICDLAKLSAEEVEGAIWALSKLQNSLTKEKDLYKVHRQKSTRTPEDKQAVRHSLALEETCQTINLKFFIVRDAIVMHSDCNEPMHNDIRAPNISTRTFSKYRYE